MNRVDLGPEVYDGIPTRSVPAGSENIIVIYGSGKPQLLIVRRKMSKPVATKVDFRGKGNRLTPIAP
jgi:hypothetical protein